MSFWNSLNRRNKTKAVQSTSRVLIEGLEPRSMFAATVAADFDGNGYTDIVFRNINTGENAIWYMGGADGKTRIGIAFLPSAPNTDWQLAGAYLFNGTVPDLLWRNASTGENAVWFMGGAGGATRTGIEYLPTAPNTDWQMAGAADFDGNGHVDIIFRNAGGTSDAGRNAVWLMGGTNGTTRIGISELPVAVNLNWVIAGAPDFDKDGDPDLLWRNITSGQNAYWQMQGTTRQAIYFLPIASVVSWSLAGGYDFDKDGDIDLLWRNLSTGQNAVWNMSADGLTRESVTFLPTAPNTDYQIAGPQLL